MAKVIPLTQGKYATVDDEDYKWLSKYKWHANRGKTGIWYAARKGIHKQGRPQTTIWIHREILGLRPGDGQECDHINHDGLDNRRANIRISTTTQNQQNRRVQPGTSKFKGVIFHRGSWLAQINIEGNRIFLGSYDSEVAAALVYDREARKHFGEFVCPNFPEVVDYRGVKLHKNLRSLGEKNPSAKLTEEQVLDIRTRREAGEKLVALAKEFGVQCDAISKIHRRRTWKHL